MESLDSTAQPQFCPQTQPQTLDFEVQNSNFPPPPPPSLPEDNYKSQDQIQNLPEPPSSEHTQNGQIEALEIQKPLLSENGALTNTHSGPADKDFSGGEEETSSRRRRRSRWDPQPDSNNNESNDSGGGPKKRKSRWADDDPKPLIQLPDFMKDFTGGIEFDPEIQALNSRLLEISRMLQAGMPLDDRPEGRSPSSEPINDNMGVRINTREFRARERLNKARQEIISNIIKKNPAFKPPADYRPPKLQEKLYIPVKEFPGYNFIGLIIGPRGYTKENGEGDWSEDCD